MLPVKADYRSITEGFRASLITERFNTLLRLTSYHTILGYMDMTVYYMSICFVRAWKVASELLERLGKSGVDPLRDSCIREAFKRLVGSALSGLATRFAAPVKVRCDFHED